MPEQKASDVKASGGPADDGLDKDELAGAPDVGLLKQFWRFRAYGKNELRPLFTGVGMRFGELLSDMASPWPMALAIDTALKGLPLDGRLAPVAHLLGPSALGMLGVASIAVLLITMSSGAFDYFGDRLMNSAGERITMAIRRDVFAHMQRLPMSFHDKTAVGELTSRIATDTGRIEDGMVGLFATLIPGILSLTGYSLVLMFIDWRLGAIALLAAPLLFITASKYTRLTRKSTRRRRAAEGKLAGFVAESLQGIRTIHAFGRQDVHNQKFSDGNDKVLSTGLRAVELRARFVPLLEAIAAVGTATLLFVGGYGVLQHWWSVGILIVVTKYLADMLKPMRDLSKLALTFTQGAASAERIAAIFDHQAPTPTITTGLPDRVEGAIQLDDVVLDYGRGPVLNHLDLKITPGERIGLLGHNGAGKSTLLSLISGLYQPTAGAVVVDGVPLSEAPDTWRHRQIAVVLQDTFLFSGTIRENIRYGRPDATEEEVEYAASAALVTEFTELFDEGLDSLLTDGGIGLSGGQRQRVGIARALLTDAPIVLLDEPTTGLDVHAEELVVRALSELVTGRTVIMTTHRPAVLRLATRTIELRQGAILQRASLPPGLEPARRTGPASRPLGGAGRPNRHPNGSHSGPPLPGPGGRPMQPPPGAVGGPRNGQPPGAPRGGQGPNGERGPMGPPPGPGFGPRTGQPPGPPRNGRAGPPRILPPAGGPGRPRRQIGNFNQGSGHPSEQPDRWWSGGRPEPIGPLSRPGSHPALPPLGTDDDDPRATRSAINGSERGAAGQPANGNGHAHGEANGIPPNGGHSNGNGHSNGGAPSNGGSYGSYGSYGGHSTSGDHSNGDHSNGNGNGNGNAGHSGSHGNGGSDSNGDHSTSGGPSNRGHSNGNGHSNAGHSGSHGNGGSDSNGDHSTSGGPSNHGHSNGNGNAGHSGSHDNGGGHSNGGHSNGNGTGHRRGIGNVLGTAPANGPDSRGGTGNGNGSMSNGGGAGRVAGTESASGSANPGDGAPDQESSRS